MLLLPMALAAEPMILPLSADPRVGDRVVRAELRGAADSVNGLGAELVGEVAIGSRVAVAVHAGVQPAERGEQEEGVVLGGEARVELLDEAKAPIGLGLAARYAKVGFDGIDAEMEAGLTASRSFGRTRALATFTAGKDVNEDEGDLEGGLGVIHSLSPLVGLGVDARGRLAVGEVEPEDRDREDRRGWDLRAGPVLTLGNERISGFVFGGVSARGEEEESAVGGMGSVGVEASF